MPLDQGFCLDRINRIDTILKSLFLILFILSKKT
ncbi:hypothetical protein EDC35_10140 [Thiobaca trueperi]|uniref:Uncharacterized protein n=1 Tax=Thiobaca trueperi TaxID=127458 RepID=A0A4R3N9R2_9GAMM|nr:hypothetical protein EDC35_10140 [Thiobaca trueperi]